MSDTSSDSSHSGADEQTIDSDHLPSKNKRKKWTPLQGAEKQTVLNIHKQVRESWPGESRSSKSDIAKKTAEVAGISLTTVYSVLKEYRTEGCVRSPPHRRPKRKKTDDIDDMTLDAIRRKVYSISDNELPTLNKILEAINTDESLPNFSRSGLYRLLNDTLKLHVKMSRKSKPLKIKDSSISLQESPQKDLEREMVVEVNMQVVQETRSDESLISLSDIKEETVEVPVISCAEYKAEECVQSSQRSPQHKNNSLEHSLGPVEKIIINSDLLFPNNKRLKQNPLNGSEKQIVIDIYKKLQETWKEGRLSKSEISQKTADVAGICRTTVYKILKEYKTEGCVQSPPHRRPKRKKTDDLDDTTLEAIRRKVDSFSDKSLDQIHEAINSDASLPNFSRTGLYRLLNDILKFNIRTRRKKSSLTIN